MPKRSVDLRPVHRICGTLLVLFLLYVGATGTALQLVDLRAIVSHAPATDPDMAAIRESIDGPSNYAVIAPADYAAAAFAPHYDLDAALTRVGTAAHAAGGSAPLKFVELRVIGGRAVGRVMLGDRLMQFDPSNGTRLPDVAPSSLRPPPSSRHLAIKSWHRLWGLGDGMLWVDMFIGVGLLVMIVTGLMLYVRLLRARARTGRTALLWSHGGWLKAAHRAIALAAAALLLVVGVTGTLLSMDSFALQLYRWARPAQLVHGMVPIGMVGDYSSPLVPARLVAMLDTTLAAYRREDGAHPIKVIRLRRFAGTPQGVIVSGGSDTRQMIFDAATGRRMTMTEAGYPYTGFPTGWELHELLKRIHRGDAFGLPGRLLDLLAGLSLIFLSISGLWMYLDLWQRRKRAGRPAIFWR